MIAVRLLSANLFRVMDRATPTVDLPADLERRAGNALERESKLHYLTREGRENVMTVNSKKLAFRKPGEVFLVRTDDTAPDGRSLWLIASVDGRV